MIASKNCRMPILAHEITHAMFQTRNIFLAESLALYVQSVVAGENDWPFNDDLFVQRERYALVDLLDETIWALKLFSKKNLILGESVGAYYAAFDFIRWCLKSLSLGSFLEIYNAFGDTSESSSELIELVDSAFHIRLSDYDNAGLCVDGNSSVSAVGSSDVGCLPSKIDVAYTSLRERYDSVRFSKDSKDLQEIFQLISAMPHSSHLMMCVLEIRVLLSLIYVQLNSRAGSAQCQIDVKPYGSKCAELVKRYIEIWPSCSELHVLHSEIIALQIADAPEYCRLKLAIKMQAEINKALTLDEKNINAYISMVKILCNTPKVLVAASWLPGNALHRRKNWMEQILILLRSKHILIFLMAKKTKRSRNWKRYLLPTRIIPWRSICWKNARLREGLIHDWIQACHMGISVS